MGTGSRMVGCQELPGSGELFNVYRFSVLKDERSSCGRARMIMQQCKFISLNCALTAGQASKFMCILPIILKIKGIRFRKMEELLALLVSIFKDSFWLFNS